MDFYKSAMNGADIKNERLLKILSRCSDLIKNPLLKDVAVENEKEEMSRWVNKEYLDEVVQMGRSHNGFPVSAKAFSLQVGNFNLGDSVKNSELTKIISDINSDLLAELGVRHNALFMVYPPGGYISWHNNANASGYNVLLTWSEKGDGAWEHIEGKTGEHVVIPDIPGWQCKYGYYGSYDDGDRSLLYHCAHTNCWRMTIAFVYNRDESGRNMAEMMVEDISNDYK